MKMYQCRLSSFVLCRVLRLDISDVDPSLISRQNELAKAQLEDGIKQHLETRPGIVTLVGVNYLVNIV